MKYWFKITYTDGTFDWVRSSRSWAGLLPYFAKLPDEPKTNGATVCMATRFESLLCCIRNFFGAKNCVEVQ